MGDACGRCGGKGWRWTGQARIACRCPAGTRPPVDPVVTENYVLIPVDLWPAVSARLRARR